MNNLEKGNTKTQEYLNILKEAKKNKIKYEPVPSFIKSFSAGIDYIIIFIFFLCLSYFFKHQIHIMMNHSFNESLGNNIDIESGVNSLYSTGENTSYFNSFLTEFNDIFYLAIVGYFSFWGLVISFFFTGHTVGSRLFSLKLCDINNKAHEATPLQRFIRCGVYFIDFSFLFGLGTIYSIFNKEKRSLAEVISKTIVLRRIN